MIQDQDQMCSYGSSGSGESSIIRSSSKKLKQTKVPQRGLGVAQLEKIRIEEEQKKDAKFSPPPMDSIPCSPPPPPPPPPQPLIPSNFPSSGPLFRTHSMPNNENFHIGSLPPLNPPTTVGGFSIGWPSIPVHGNVNLPNLWHHELHIDHKEENSSFLHDLSLPYETCSITPPNVLPKPHYYHHRPQQQQQQSSFSLENNVSSTNLATPSSSSFVPKFPMEPPSNQNYFSNYLPSWPDDQKVMLGMKRPCPFSLDDPPIPIFRSTFAPITKPITGTEESTSCQNGSTMHNLEPPMFRDFASCPSVTHEPTTSLRKSTKSQIGNSSEELLTLAPTTVPSSFPNSISKQSSMILTSNKKEICNFKALPYQVSVDDALINSRHGGSSQQPKCISLFPCTKLQATSETTPTNQNGCNCEVGENIDLNLRL